MEKCSRACKHVKQNFKTTSKAETQLEMHYKISSYANMFLTNIKCDEIAMMNIFILTKKTLLTETLLFRPTLWRIYHVGYKYFASKVQ